MPFSRFVLFVSLIAAGASPLADDVIDTDRKPKPQVDCPRLEDEKPLATEYGSAGFMKNLAESADSIRTIAVRLLTSALSADHAPPANCQSNCAAGEIPEVIYRVAPVAFLAEDKQNEVCLTFEDETSVDPMRFGPRTFASVGELNDWIMSFSQGRGVDGKALYERCSSNCSPRYTFRIAERNAAYEVNAEVLCGLARDKSNDQYLISTALRRSCAID